MTRPEEIACLNTFDTERVLAVGDDSFRIHSLDGVDTDALPYSLRVVLENLLRHEDGHRITAEQIQLLLDWSRGPDHTAAVDLNPVLCPDAPICRPVIGNTVVWKDPDHVTGTFLDEQREELWARLTQTGFW